MSSDSLIEKIEALKTKVGPAMLTDFGHVRNATLDQVIVLIMGDADIREDSGLNSGLSPLLSPDSSLQTSPDTLIGKLKFSDEVSNIAASTNNPIKHGIFVRHLHAGMAEYVTAQGVHHTPIDNLQRREISVLDEEVIAQGWFQKQVASAQKDVLAWPQWLKDHLHDEVPKRESIDIAKLKHFHDSSLGLWAIDRDPKEVTHEWIKENAFQLDGVTHVNAK